MQDSPLPLAALRDPPCRQVIIVCMTFLFVYFFNNFIHIYIYSAIIDIIM